MFEVKCEQIQLNEEDSYPFKFDNYVMEQVQKKYGSINTFEFLLKGYRYKVNEHGEYDLKDGERQIEIVEPDIETMNFILPLMIREGMEIEGKDLEATDKELIRSINRPYYEIAEEIKAEFGRCFISTKKQKPRRVKKAVR